MSAPLDKSIVPKPLQNRPGVIPPSPAIPIPEKKETPIVEEVSDSEEGDSSEYTTDEDDDSFSTSSSGSTNSDDYVEATSLHDVSKPTIVIPPRPSLRSSQVLPAARPIVPPKVVVEKVKPQSKKKQCNQSSRR